MSKSQEAGLVNPSTLLKYTGHLHFRTRIVLSILSGKTLRIDRIRPDDSNPGLRDYEASLLRLVEKVTNGSVIEISYTGTSILLKPGVIIGGSITHDCPLSRSVVYFLEPLIMIAPFSKKPFSVTLRGITSDDLDLGVDIIRTVTLPHLKLFGIDDGLELKIKKRGAKPLGGGEIQFLCPIVKQLKTLNFIERGKIKRIRGIAHAVRISPQFANRMVDTSRSVLNQFINDIYIYSDVYKGEDSGKSPGYALSLLAETTTGALHCSEGVSVPGGAPEDVAMKASQDLLNEISRGGCVDRYHQVLVLLMMVLGSEDVGRCRMGEPTARTIQFLRDVRDFFGTSFKIVEVAPPQISRRERAAVDSGSESEAEAESGDLNSKELLFSCFGVGYVNTNRTLA